MELLELLKIIGKYRAIIMVLVASSVLFTVALTYVVEERFESSALVLVRPQERLSFSGPQGDKETLDFPIPRVVPFEAMTKTVAEVIRSRTVAAEIVTRLGLDKPSVETVWWKIWKRKIKGFFADVWTYLKYGRVEPSDPRAEATELVQKLITVEPTKDTYVFEIKFLAKLPEVAAAVVNTAADVFVQYNLDMSHKESGATREFIEAQVQTSAAAVAAARAALKNYQESHAIVELDKEVENSVNAVAALALERDKVERDAVSTKARVEALSRQLGIGAGGAKKDAPRLLAGGLRDAVMAKLVVAQSELESYGAASLRLRSTISQQRAQLEGLPEQQLELSRLKLDLAVGEDTYRFVRKAYDQARIREAEQTREIRVIAPAIVETYPVRPVKVYYAGVALALSLVVGLILALFFEYLNFTLETTSGAQEALQLPLLASFPHIDA